MALIDEVLGSGAIDPDTTQEYKAKAPMILTTLQNELVGIDNRYRKESERVYPVIIESLDQPLQVDSIKATTLLAYGLAAHLMLDEDTAKASFFEQRYEELRAVFLKPIPQKPESKLDVYDASLNY